MLPVQLAADMFNDDEDDEMMDDVSTNSFKVAECNRSIFPVLFRCEAKTEGYVARTCAYPGTL